MVARPGGGAGGSAAGQARAVARLGERATRARFGQAGDFLPVRSGNFGRNEMSGSAWTGDSKPNPNHSSNTPVRSAGAGTDWADGADGLPWCARPGPGRPAPDGRPRPSDGSCRRRRATPAALSPGAVLGPRGSCYRPPDLNVVTTCNRYCTACITRTPRGAGSPLGLRVRGKRAAWLWGKPCVAEGDLRPGADRSPTGSPGCAVPGKSRTPRQADEGRDSGRGIFVLWAAPPGGVAPLAGGELPLSLPFNLCCPDTYRSSILSGVSLWAETATA